MNFAYIFCAKIILPFSGYCVGISPLSSVTQVFFQIRHWIIASPMCMLLQNEKKFEQVLLRTVERGKCQDEKTHTQDVGNWIFTNQKRGWERWKISIALHICDMVCAFWAWYCYADGHKTSTTKTEIPTGMLDAASAVCCCFLMWCSSIEPLNIALAAEFYLSKLKCFRTLNSSSLEIEYFDSIFPPIHPLTTLIEKQATRVQPRAHTFVMQISICAMFSQRLALHFLA